MYRDNSLGFILSLYALVQRPFRPRIVVFVSCFIPTCHDEVNDVSKSLNFSLWMLSCRNKRSRYLMACGTVQCIFRTSLIPSCVVYHHCKPFLISLGPTAQNATMRPQ